MAFADWSGRLKTVGASTVELTSISASYQQTASTVQAALDTLVASQSNAQLLTMLNVWRANPGPFQNGYPGGGLLFGTGVAVLTGQTADDSFPISAGTGQRMQSVVSAGSPAPSPGTTGQSIVVRSDGTIGYLTDVVRASAWGVDPSNADNTTALNNAFAAAQHGTLRLPPGTLNFAGQLTADSCNIDGAGYDATVLQCNTQLGATTPALHYTATDSQIRVIRGFHLRGPTASTLGTKTANCWGLQLDQEAFLSDVHIDRFDAGLVLNSPPGHIYGQWLNITSNYYGLYFIQDNGDYHFTDCTINGNSYANIAAPAGVGITSGKFDRCHIGFAPYAVYEEAAPASQGSGKWFLQEVTFDNSRFESIGNAAIWSDATDTGTNYSQFADVTIINPGFGWAGNSPGGSATYSLPSKPASYAIKVGHTARNITIIDGPYPFLPGTTTPTVAASAASAGLYFVNTAQHNAWTRIYAGPVNPATDLTLGTGGGFLNYHAGTNTPTNADIGVLGDGSDGIATLDGVATVGWATLAGSTYTMTRPALLASLTINAGVTLVPNGFPIFCRGAVVNAGTITADGGAGAANGTAGAALVSANPILAGSSGGAGQTAAGTSATYGNAGGPSSVIGSGGAGGLGASGAGGSAAPAASGYGLAYYRNPRLLSGGFAVIGGQVKAIGGGAGGGGGGGDGTNKGGGGGAGGGIIAIYAQTFSSTGTLTAKGGAGGTPTTGNAGGGGGGGGGLIAVYTSNSYSNTGTTSITAGVAGNGVGTGANGSAGVNGSTIATAA